MASSSSALNSDLFSSLISDIKTYTGKDPLFPWLRGIRKMRECLPPQLLKEKLPRFLQKCAQTFESDRRYKNDLRYLRVWLQLMDFVEDPKAVLRTMEVNHIGKKKSLFYQAYALYYEKVKKFEDAEKMYHLGVQNLAEPMGELQKSYEMFLSRMKRQNSKRIMHQGRRTTKRPLASANIPCNFDETNEIDANTCGVEGGGKGTCSKEPLPETRHSSRHLENKVMVDSSQIGVSMKQSSHNTRVAVNSCEAEESRFPYLKMDIMEDLGCRSNLLQQNDSAAESVERSNACSDDTVVVKFVDTAIVGKSRAEDACHHGLVEPTINTKEALNAINSMFREPLEPTFLSKRSCGSQPKVDQGMSNGFEVFTDENMDNKTESSKRNVEDFIPLEYDRSRPCQPLSGPLQIYVDAEESNDVKETINENENFEQNIIQQFTEDATVSTAHENAFVFPSPKDLLLESSNDRYVEESPQANIREDTVVCRFVGSTISDEPEVENACHHGLIEPTVNLKQAMDDINSMFGKPIEFVRTNRSKKQAKVPDGENNCGGFVILADDDLDYQQKPLPSASTKNEFDLYEPTMCTREAMDEINKMFGMPLDF